MIVGLLFISTLTATVTTALAVSLGMPLWLGLVTFPVIGSVTLLLLALVVYLLRSSDPAMENEMHDMVEKHTATA